MVDVVEMVGVAVGVIGLVGGGLRWAFSRISTVEKAQNDRIDAIVRDLGEYKLRSAENFVTGKMLSEAESRTAAAIEGLRTEIRGLGASIINAIVGDRFKQNHQN